MTITPRGILADAVTLWRGERELVAPLAGLFFVVPILGAALLLSGFDMPQGGDSEQLREALVAFHSANLVPILAISLVLDFGTFALFTLYLQGTGRTLGEVLSLALRRFAGFFAINTVAGLLFSFGLSLLVVPGLFVLARTWLIGPAYAADPQGGIGGAVREGWRRSSGLNGFALVGLAALILLAGLGLVLIAGLLLATVAAATGAVQLVSAVSLIVTALIGGTVWAAMALIRVSAYRLSGSSSSGT